MCGFCGLIHPQGFPPPEKSLLKAMTQTIIHRGPDEEGLYLDEQTGLGVRRLSIIDLEKGHQPLSNEKGTIWIAYNGEGMGGKFHSEVTGNVRFCSLGQG